MAVSKAQQRATNKYISRAYDRVNLTMPKGQKDDVQSFVSGTGESVNAFINRAIAQAMNGGAILTPKALETAQRAAKAAGEQIPVFIERAVTAQEKRDSMAKSLGG